MIDQTPEFLKALKACRRSDGLLEKKSLLLRNKFTPQTQFGKLSADMVSNITKLRDFLLENSKNYLSHATNDNSCGIGDQERAELDLHAESFIKTCTESLSNLKQKEIPSKCNDQTKAHKLHAIEIIEDYLKSVSQIQKRQHALRSKHLMEKRRLASSLHGAALKAPASESPPEEEVSKMKSDLYASKSFLYEDSDDEVSSDDEAVFREENAQLFSDMNKMMEEVKVIEGKVVEIARLHEMFSDQVQLQEGEINLVAEKIVESSENVKGGNEEVREAIKNNAGFRVWILFFLIMCSFSLLFLEWYS
ncbi:syntaxin-18-like [Clavelina lepadiformis]|uniref:syntaxin-18-like n=1 Tax=Clavelina lepadiformis TaxID=159417 RepID=UPI0040412D0A